MEEERDKGGRIRRNGGRKGKRAGEERGGEGDVEE